MKLQFAIFFKLDIALIVLQQSWNLPATKCVEVWGENFNFHRRVVMFLKIISNLVISNCSLEWQRNTLETRNAKSETSVFVFAVFVFRRRPCLIKLLFFFISVFVSNLSFFCNNCCTNIVNV